jgi:ubiquinone/menaquinone biosynthesis C-methylase UbiE
MPSEHEHPWFARVYERLTARADLRGDDKMRARLTRGLSGRVLEIGAGNGLNFRYYAAGVRVVGIEPDPHMLARAVPRIARAAAKIELAAADGQSLPFHTASFDAAVVCLVLCTIPDPGSALSEIRRVMKPGGQVRFFEHVRAPGRVIAGIQNAVDPLWARAFAGCHPNRDTAEVIRRAGFRIEDAGSWMRGIFIGGTAVAA